jgi:hypothetical protein
MVLNKKNLNSLTLVWVINPNWVGDCLFIKTRFVRRKELGLKGSGMEDLKEIPLSNIIERALPQSYDWKMWEDAWS